MSDERSHVMALLAQVSGELEDIARALRSPLANVQTVRVAQSELERLSEALRTDAVANSAQWVRERSGNEI